MNKARLFLGAMGAMALASGTVFGGSSDARTAQVAAKKAVTPCRATIAIEAPLTGSSLAQLGLETLHFTELAVAHDNAVNHTKVTLAQDDTQFTPSIAITKAQAIISSNAVAVVGPASSGEAAAVGPLFARAQIAFVSGSATNPTLTTSGANPTFFRVVPPDSVQGPQDANYIAKVLKPKAVMIVDDESSYSTDLVSQITPILQAAGIAVTHESYNGSATGVPDFSSIVSGVTPAQTVMILPWQNASSAQQFGLDLSAQGKTATIFGTDGTDSPTQFKITGSIVSNFGPDISTSKNPYDVAIVKGVKKYGPYGSFGVPNYAATDVEMQAIAAVCKARHKPTRANVLAAVRKTNILPSAIGQRITFQKDGDLKNGKFYLFKINSAGAYIPIASKS